MDGHEGTPGHGHIPSTGQFVAGIAEQLAVGGFESPEKAGAVRNLAVEALVLLTGVDEDQAGQQVDSSVDEFKRELDGEA